VDTKPGVKKPRAKKPRAKKPEPVSIGDEPVAEVAVVPEPEPETQQFVVFRGRQSGMSSGKLPGVFFWREKPLAVTEEQYQTIVADGIPVEACDAEGNSL
jgi:hypothetical protein